MPESRFVNLVFQGGGVRGIAYAGALSKVPENVRISGVGGASAGAIVAALLATGSSPAELRNKLEDERLFSLIGEDEVLFRDGIVDLAVELQRISQGGRGFALARRGWKVWRRWKALREGLSGAWSRRGLHTNVQLREWLESLFGDQTIESAEPDLKIVAADVSSREYLVFEKNSRHSFLRNAKISDAVLASVSIPLFFEPHFYNNRFLVDGGMLSNFPSFLFSYSRYRTIGFRLKTVELPSSIENTGDYLASLAGTTIEAHDKHRGDPELFSSHEIIVPRSIASTKFDLDPEDAEELFHLGAMAARNVDWESETSRSPEIETFDPKPHEALAYCVGQGHKLYESYTQGHEWADEIRLETDFTVRVEQDWTTQYDSETTVSIGGGVMHMNVARAIAGPVSTFRETSITDIDLVYQELTGEAKDLVRFPARNSSEEKCFVVFYDPPIVPGQSPRKFRMSFRIPGEFQDTLGDNGRDEVSYRVRPRAPSHHLGLVFRLLLSAQLPPLRILPEFSWDQEDEGHVEVDGELYRSRVWSLPSRSITEESVFKVALGPIP